MHALDHTGAGISTLGMYESAEIELMNYRVLFDARRVNGFFVPSKLELMENADGHKSTELWRSPHMRMNSFKNLRLRFAVTVDINGSLNFIDLFQAQNHFL